MMVIEWSRISLAIEWQYGSMRYHRLAIRFMDTHIEHGHMLAIERYPNILGHLTASS